jgi:hypothetical protein
MSGVRSTMHCSCWLQSATAPSAAPTSCAWPPTRASASPASHRPAPPPVSRVRPDVALLVNQTLANIMHCDHLAIHSHAHCRLRGALPWERYLCRAERVRLQRGLFRERLCLQTMCVLTLSTNATLTNRSNCSSSPPRCSLNGTISFLPTACQNITCSPNGLCAAPGDCECNPGFVGDGVTCVASVCLPRKLLQGCSTLCGQANATGTHIGH